MMKIVTIASQTDEVDLVAGRLQELTDTRSPDEARDELRPAMRLRHANAQPCSSPPTTDGKCGRDHDEPQRGDPRAPNTRPARSRIGGTWSTPSMMPWRSTVPRRARRRR